MMHDGRDGNDSDVDDDRNHYQTFSHFSIYPVQFVLLLASQRIWLIYFAVCLCMCAVRVYDFAEIYLYQCS